jgi:hypothetical protein
MSDMQETIDEFDGIKKLGQGLSIIGWLTSSNNVSDASISMSIFVNANMEADKNNKYIVIGIVFGVRRRREGIHHCISRTSLARSKNRYVFTKQ